MSTNIEFGHHHHQMDNNSSTATTTMRKDNNSNIHISAPTSKSSSTATSSSPIPIAPAPAPASSTNSKYSMEEVWKDICLPSLHNPAKTTAIPSSTEGIISQEISSPPSRPAQYHSPSQHHDHGLHSSFGSTDSGFFESHGRQPATSTVLSLNTKRAPSLFSLPQDHDLDANNLDSSTVEYSILPKKRVPQNEDTNHRNKRMMKNRESAARSRARKQAYTNELEIKVARLMEENAKLRRQQQKLCLEASAQLPKKNMLYRTLTAPF